MHGDSQIAGAQSPSTVASPVAKAPTEVERAMAALQQLVTNLDAEVDMTAAALDQHYERIAPILAPQPPQSAPDVEPDRPGYNSSLAEAIANYTGAAELCVHRLAVLRHGLLGVNERVEL